MAEKTSRELQIQRLRLGVEAKAFLDTPLFDELKKRIGEHIDANNQAYWTSWKVNDAGKTTAYLTGKRAGLTLLTDILNSLFVQGEAAVFEIEKNKITEGHG